MATIRDLRSRLDLIKNLKQYTMALEIISATRLKKAKPAALRSGRFHEKLKNIVMEMALSNPDANHPLLQERNVVKKRGLIVVAGDKGHCGVYNSGIIKEADRYLRNESREVVELILFGDKAISYFSHKTWPIALKVPKWTGKITNEQIHTISGQCIDWFCTEKMDEINILYTKQYGLVKKEIVIEKFLNLSLPNSGQILFSPDPVFEPAPNEIYEKLLALYCFANLKRILELSYSWELMARNFAMQMATTNAQNLSETVTLLLNKVRQTEITKEALEIATSATI